MNITLTLCEGVALRCALCHDDDLDGVLLCPGCRTRVHAECRVGVACPTLGCTQGRHCVARVTAAPRLSVATLPFFERQLLPGFGGWLVLVFIAMVLLAHLTVGVMGQGHVARVERVRADMRAIGDALVLFRRDCGDHPRQLSSLWERPAELPRWSGPYLPEGPPQDPWNTAYVYVRTEGGSYEILSEGADGQPGGDDEDADLSSLTINARE